MTEASATVAGATGAGIPDLGDLPTWRLSDLYESPEDPALARDLAWIGEAAARFADRFQGKLADLDGDGLAASLAEYEDIQRRSIRPGLYVQLRYQQDTLDPERGKLLGDVSSQLTEQTRPLVFYVLELNRLEEARLESALDASPALARYRAWLKRIRSMREHQLEDRLEEYIHDRSPVEDEAWHRLFSETWGEATFEVAGEKLSLEPTLNLLLDPDPLRREQAWRALAQVFARDIRLFTLIMNTLVKSKEVDDRWRKLPSPDAARHLANAVEAEIVEALRTAVVDAYPRISHRYYAMKARWLGQERLNAWDRNAPLPDDSDRRYRWDEARDIVTGAYGEFSPRFGELAERFFENGWIDAPVTKGKAPGAFSASGPVDVHPYVMLNYLGRTRDVMTLAHELGHGVHQVLAAGQGQLLAGTPLTFAETASVFGEMLAFRRLLEGEPERAARRALLAGKAEDMINTVVRQISFYEFELRVHDERRKGELTAEQLGEIWLEVSRESLGPAVELNPGYQNFWCYVGHFVAVPFYVYAYAFGDGLVNALYAIYRREPAGFAERYMEMLAAGGSRFHDELLAPFGLDLRDPDFWRVGLDLIAETIDEAERLAESGARD